MEQYRQEAEALAEGTIDLMRAVLVKHNIGVIAGAHQRLNEAAAVILRQSDEIKLLKQHLRAVLEICRVWEPDYASGMDRKTLVLAADAARDFMTPN